MRGKLRAEDEALLRAYEADNFRLYDRPASGRHRAPTPPHRMRNTFAIISLLMVALISDAEFAGTAEDDARPTSNDSALAMVDSSIEDIKAEIASRQAALRNVERAERSATRAVTTKKKAVNSVVKRSPRPVSWVKPLNSYRLTSCYERRWGAMHYGIDMATRQGTPIHSAGAGVVIQVGWRYSGYGITVVVDHGDGWLTMYAHASRALVRTGQHVLPGQNIALVGSTGFSTGPHLHFSVIHGKLKSWPPNWKNPGSWLRARGVSLGGC